MEKQLNIEDLHEYQLKAVKHIIANPKSALLLDMGLGKSVSTLTAIKYLMFQELEVMKVLIIAPKRVAESVWDAEISKWSHLSNLTIAKIIGTEKQRLKALNTKAHIYTIGRDNIPWLCAQFGGNNLPFDMVVIDELSSFKNPGSRRFRALRKAIPSVDRVVGLTGTPAPNGLIDLWSQIYLLDEGERLHKTITKFRGLYFTKGYSGWGYDVTEYGEKRIPELIQDIVISMKKEDYLDMEEPIINDVVIEMPPDIRKKYEEFQEEAVLEIFSGIDEITAVNAAALRSKLLQFSNGAVYDAERRVHYIHNLKLEALEDIVEEANGKPVLVAYCFEHDRDRILKKFKNAIHLKTDQHIKDWNAGKIPMLVMHPASGGHGINLQKGSNIIAWFGLNDSLELYQQFNARLHRQGQDQVVIINRILCRGTEDYSVVKNLDRKEKGQAGLMESVKALVSKYIKNFF